MLVHSPCIAQSRDDQERVLDLVIEHVAASNGQFTDKMLKMVIDQVAKEVR